MTKDEKKQAKHKHWCNTRISLSLDQVLCNCNFEQVSNVADGVNFVNWHDDLSQLIARIKQAEREACAKVASSMVLPDASNYPFHIAAAIRNRGETK